MSETVGDIGGAGGSLAREQRGQHHGVGSSFEEGVCWQDEDQPHGRKESRIAATVSQATTATDPETPRCMSDEQELAAMTRGISTSSGSTPETKSQHGRKPGSTSSGLGKEKDLPSDGLCLEHSSPGKKTERLLCGPSLSPEFFEAFEKLQRRLAVVKQNLSGPYAEEEKTKRVEGGQDSGVAAEDRALGCWKVAQERTEGTLGGLKVIR